MGQNHWRFPLFTDVAVNNARDAFPIELLSLYDDDSRDSSIGSIFLCNIINAHTRQQETTLNRRASSAVRH